ncbi:cyclin-D5-1 [Morus notabilis]|uniref:cyclin-D5-1 n=1 Tax=Morus notabilis TaxID=981085 RepID=UPI000CED005B|nr:cyclin-D5-1 [Morus notabilis]
MGDSETNPFCFSSLLCQEDHESCFTEQEEDEENTYCYNTNDNNKPFFVSEDDEEFVQTMFKREEEEKAFFGSKASSSPSLASDDWNSSSIRTQSWFKSARLKALEWIYNTRAQFGFHFKTAYLSVTYFDRFLSKRYIDSGKMWAIRLLSVACLSLAAKMEECNVPMLSEFRVQDYNFESKVIKRMELLVLSALEWKMGSITPFAYLNYFTNKFGGENSQRLVVSTAVELILAMIEETNLIDIRPSIIAASAVLVASDGQLTGKTMELKMNVISFWRSEDKEDMYSCCNLFQEIEKRKVKTPSEFSFSWKNSSFNSTESTKRRLSFNERDHQTSPVKKVHRT